MQTTRIVLATIAASMMLLAVVGWVGFAWQTHERNQAESNTTQLDSRLVATREVVATLREENRSLKHNLAESTSDQAKLAERIDVLEKQAEAFASTPPQPYRVRAFVGRDSIGEAWMIPHNISKDDNLGRYLYEPVLLIDETAREHFTVHHTNVVEREVQTTQIYQQEFGYPYYYYLPAGRTRPPNRPDRPDRPSPPQPAQPGTVMQPDANLRVFAPPNSIVNTRPQVIGTPATPGANQRVFGP